MVLLEPVVAQRASLTLQADLQEANANTGIVVAKGNVRLEYPAYKMTAKANQAIYAERQGSITLTGDVVIERQGRDQLKAEKITYYVKENRLRAEPAEGQQVVGSYVIQSEGSGKASIRSDLQEANTLTGEITATGNIRLEYPTRQIIATAQKATYSNKDRTILMQGNVSILQQGSNTLQAESITYAIDESRFLAVPSSGKQVRATYSIPPSPTP